VYLKANKPKKRVGNRQKAKLITKVLLKNSNILSAFWIATVFSKENKLPQQ
jgi:hypothetical protein